MTPEKKEQNWELKKIVFFVYFSYISKFNNNFAGKCFLKY